MPVTPSVSEFGSTSENVRCLKSPAGIATCQPNQIFSSAAPMRIVPKLAPLGRCERFGIAGAPRPPVCAAIETAAAMSAIAVLHIGSPFLNAELVPQLRQVRLAGLRSLG